MGIVPSLCSSCNDNMKGPLKIWFPVTQWSNIINVSCLCLRRALISFLLQDLVTDSISAFTEFMSFGRLCFHCHCLKIFSKFFVGSSLTHLLFKSVLCNFQIFCLISVHSSQLSFHCYVGGTIFSIVHFEPIFVFRSKVNLLYTTYSWFMFCFLFFNSFCQSLTFDGRV